MSQKIHRRGPSVFNKKRHKVLKGVGYTVLGLAFLSVGFLAAKYMADTLHNASIKTASSSNTSTAAVESQTESSEPEETETQPTDSSTPDSSVGGSALRAFYLPVSQLGDTAALDAQLDNASKAGFNAVLFDLKDENGALHYVSGTELAQKSKATAKDALTLDALKTAQKHIADKGFTAIGRLFAFKDATSPTNLPSAKVTLQGETGTTWLDNSLDKGGKPWLSPYSPDAQRYIIDMAKELSGNGFTAVMLDGVQFPNQTYRAYFGKTELSSLSQQAVLQKFVKDLSSAVGTNCHVMQTMPGLSAFGDGTAPYGGNPVTFGASVVSPMLMPSTLGSKLSTNDNTLSNPASDPYNAIKMSLGQVNLRLELIDQQSRPTLMPWLQGYSYNADQINQQIKAANETLGSNASYILYNQDGKYDFSSIKQQ